MAKSDYYDDPEEYFRELEERNEDKWNSMREHWEKENPNRVWMQSEPKDSNE